MKNVLTLCRVLWKMQSMCVNNGTKIKEKRSLLQNRKKNNPLR